MPPSVDSSSQVGPLRRSVLVMSDSESCGSKRCSDTSSGVLHKKRRVAGSFELLSPVKEADFSGGSTPGAPSDSESDGGQCGSLPASSHEVSPSAVQVSEPVPEIMRPNESMTSDRDRFCAHCHASFK